MFESKPASSRAGEKNGLPTPPNESPPPSYAANDGSNVPDITAAFSKLSLQASSKPTVDQCIAHLKLLEAFHHLREDVALNDGLFGLQDAFVPSTGDERQRAGLLTKIREKRWAVYVAKAAKRFETWWEKVIEPDAPKLEQKNIPFVFGQDPQAGLALNIDRDHLPPLGEAHLLPV